MAVCADSGEAWAAQRSYCERRAAHASPRPDRSADLARPTEPAGPISSPNATVITPRELGVALPSTTAAGRDWICPCSTRSRNEWTYGVEAYGNAADGILDFADGRALPTLPWDLDLVGLGIPGCTGNLPCRVWAGMAQIPEDWHAGSRYCKIGSLGRRWARRGVEVTDTQKRERERLARAPACAGCDVGGDRRGLSASATA